MKKRHVLCTLVLTGLLLGGCSQLQKTEKDADSSSSSVPVETISVTEAGSASSEKEDSASSASETAASSAASVSASSAAGSSAKSDSSVKDTSENTSSEATTAEAADAEVKSEAAADAPGVGDAAGFTEIPIFEDKECGFLNVSAVYFQPVPMSGGNESIEGFDMHLEADVSALENSLGFGVGDWVPYMTVDYKVIASSGDTAAEGS